MNGKRNLKKGGKLLKRIAITGPESTGKSLLARQLAKHYNTVWVPEYAREYINNLNRPYNQGDILKIAKGQIKTENEMAAKANKILICDTELLVTKIWIEHKYKNCHPWILETIKKHTYDLYLLCNIDLQWQPDPLREHPQIRDYFLKLYLNELKNRNFIFEIISGLKEDRLKNAIMAIENILV